MQVSEEKKRADLPPSEDGSRVQGIRDQGSGFTVQGFRVQGAGFRVQGSGFRVQGSGFRVQGCRVQGCLQARTARARG